MIFKKTFKKFLRLVSNNYFIAIFFAAIAFVALISFYRIFFVKPTYIYVKVKIGQGLWWAATQKPSLWFIENIKKAKNEEEKDFSGKTQAKILSIRYYPTYLQNQYDVYLTMKIKVSKLGKTGKYNFKRSSIGVSSPIDFEFPSVQFSGTVIELSEQPIKENRQEKIVYLSKPYAFSWEYETIRVGDEYFDGEETVVQILEKSIGEKYNIIPPYQSVIDPTMSQTRSNIFVKVKIKGKKRGNNFIFGEEQAVAPGKFLYISTANFFFDEYIVADIK